MTTTDIAIATMTLARDAAEGRILLESLAALDAHGIPMSISPPIQAQSAGVQPRSPGRGKPSWAHSIDGRWPIRNLCACSTPFGGPVVPEV